MFTRCRRSPLNPATFPPPSIAPSAASSRISVAERADFHGRTGALRRQGVVSCPLCDVVADAVVVLHMTWKAVSAAPLHDIPAENVACAPIGGCEIPLIPLPVHIDDDVRLTTLYFPISSTNAIPTTPHIVSNGHVSLAPARGCSGNPSGGRCCRGSRCVCSVGSPALFWPEMTFPLISCSSILDADAEGVA